MPVAFGIGTLFADAAYRQLQTGQPLAFYRTLVLNNIYQIFFFSWIPVYFMLNYFGWETTHMWWHADSVTAYPFYTPTFIVVFFAAANGGFLLGNRLVKQGRLGTNRAVYLGILIYSAVWILAQTNSTFRLGTYAEWIRGEAASVCQNPTFLGMLIFTLLVWGAGAGHFLRQAAQGGKRKVGLKGLSRRVWPGAEGSSVTSLITASEGVLCQLRQRP